jgi:hypothetical protein
VRPSEPCYRFLYAIGFTPWEDIADIAAAYPEWRVIDEQAVDISSVPFYRIVPKADPRFYRLHRG